MASKRPVAVIPEDVDALCCASLIEAPLGKTEAVEFARVLGALADPVRIRLLSTVAAQGEVCSCDL